MGSTTFKMNNEKKKKRKMGYKKERENNLLKNILKNRGLSFLFLR